MKRLTILLIALLATAAAIAQDDSTRYRYPLNLDPLYSAGFAEMRPNHFHSGVDLKTEGVEGHPLYAIADGEVVLTPTKDSTVSKSATVYKTTPLDDSVYTYVPWEELHLLPVGEYVVVYSENIDSRNWNPNADTYWISQFHMIFCLVVPVK